MKRRLLVVATLVGIALQLGLVFASHVVRALQDPGFAIGGVAFSAVAGWIYARLARSDWQNTLIGGGSAGGVCAAVGIAVSAALGDMPISLLILGTSVSVMTGIAAAGFAKLLQAAGSDCRNPDSSGLVTAAVRDISFAPAFPVQTLIRMTRLPSHSPPLTKFCYWRRSRRR